MLQSGPGEQQQDVSTSPLSKPKSPPTTGNVPPLPVPGPAHLATIKREQQREEDGARNVPVTHGEALARTTVSTDVQRAIGIHDVLMNPDDDQQGCPGGGPGGIEAQPPGRPSSTSPASGAVAGARGPQPGFPPPPRPETTPIGSTAGHQANPVRQLPPPPQPPLPLPPPPPPPPQTSDVRSERGSPTTHHLQPGLGPSSGPGSGSIAQRRILTPKSRAVSLGGRAVATAGPRPFEPSQQQQQPPHGYQQPGHAGWPGGRSISMGEIPPLPQQHREILPPVPQPPPPSLGIQQPGYVQSGPAGGSGPFAGGRPSSYSPFSEPPNPFSQPGLGARSLSQDASAAPPGPPLRMPGPGGGSGGGPQGQPPLQPPAQFPPQFPPPNPQLAALAHPSMQQGPRYWMGGEAGGAQWNQPPFRPDLVGGGGGEAVAHDIALAHPELAGLLVPVDTKQASRLADEKRLRNAGASARFRQRKKEKERKQQQEYQDLALLNVMLERRNEKLEMQCEHYRSERNRLRDLLRRATDPGLAEQADAGPPSPVFSSASQEGGRGVGNEPLQSRSSPMHTDDGGDDHQRLHRKQPLSGQGAGAGVSTSGASALVHAQTRVSGVQGQGGTTGVTGSHALASQQQHQQSSRQPQSRIPTPTMTSANPPHYPPRLPTTTSAETRTSTTHAPPSPSDELAAEHGRPARRRRIDGDSPVLPLPSYAPSHQQTNPSTTSVPPQLPALAPRASEDSWGPSAMQQQQQQSTSSWAQQQQLLHHEHQQKQTQSHYQPTAGPSGSGRLTPGSTSSSGGFPTPIPMTQQAGSRPQTSGSLGVGPPPPAAPPPATAGFVGGPGGVGPAETTRAGTSTGSEQRPLSGPGMLPMPSLARSSPPHPSTVSPQQQPSGAQTQPPAVTAGGPVPVSTPPAAGDSRFPFVEGAGGPAPADWSLGPPPPPLQPPRPGQTPSTRHYPGTGPPSTAPLPPPQPLEYHHGPPPNFSRPNLHPPPPSSQQQQQQHPWHGGGNGSGGHGQLPRPPTPQQQQQQHDGGGHPPPLPPPTMR